MIHRRHSFHRFVALQLAAAALALALVAALNMAVDPWDAWKWRWGAALGPYKKLSEDPAQKICGFDGGDWQVVVIGASRTELALDPLSPALRGRPAYNLGLSGASAAYIFSAANHALDEDAGLGTLVLELDPSYLRAEAKERLAAMAASPLNPAMNRMTWSLRLLWSGQVTRQSFKDIQFAMRHRRAGAFHGFHGYGEENDRTPHQLFALHEWGIPGMDSLHPERVPFELGRADALLPLARRCHARGVRLVVFVPPSHAVRLAGYAQAGYWPELKAFKVRLASLAGEGGFDAYDFMGCGEWSTEPIPDAPGSRMKWYHEPIHFRQAMGDRLLERMLGPAAGERVPDGGFGVVLRPERVQAHLRAVDRSLAAYVAAHPGLDGLLPTDGLAARLEPPEK